MLRSIVIMLVAGMLVGCTLTVAPLQEPNTVPLEISHSGLHPIYKVLTSCAPLSDYADLDPETIGVFDGSIDGDPKRYEEMGYWYTHVDITDPDGVQCRIELHSQEGFGEWKGGDRVRLIAAYDGRGSGRTADGVSFPLHVFWLPPWND